MAIPSSIVKILTIIVPLIKEYVSSGDNSKGLITEKSLTTCVISGMILITCCGVFLAEQASANLSAHEPVMKQYAQVVKENKLLREEVNRLHAEVTTLKLAAFEIKSVEGEITNDVEHYKK